MFDVFFKNATEGWAIGDEGTILHTQTGGNVWIAEETGVKHRLEKILFAGKKVSPPVSAVRFWFTAKIQNNFNAKAQKIKFAAAKI